MPDDSLDETTSAEVNEYERRAKSPALRDVFERAQHISALNRRIDVLQGKLDRREAELDETRPKLAALQQAERTARGHGTAIQAFGSGLGPILLGVASFATDDIWKFGLFGAGAVASFIGWFSTTLAACIAWPNKPSDE